MEKSRKTIFSSTHIARAIKLRVYVVTGSYIVIENSIIRTAIVVVRIFICPKAAFPAVKL